MAPRTFSPPQPDTLSARDDVIPSLSSRAILVARSKSLSAGAKAGIGIGCFFGFAVILCVSWPFIIRFRNKIQGKEKPYDPSKEDPFHNCGRPDVSVPDRRVDTFRSVIDGPHEPLTPPDTVYDPQKPSPSDEAHDTFDPSFPIPPHFRDHPAVRLSPTDDSHLTRAHTRLDGPHVSIEPGSSSMLDHVKSSVLDTVHWSTERAQVLKRMLKEKNRQEQEISSVHTKSRMNEFDFSMPWWQFRPRPAENDTVTGPSLPHQVISPPDSPHTHVVEGLDQRVSMQPTSPTPRSGLPSPPPQDQPTFDPKHLWHPTTLTERQHSVNHELVLLETTSPESSPSPPQLLQSFPQDFILLQPSSPESIQHPSPSPPDFTHSYLSPDSTTHHLSSPSSEPPSQHLSPESTNLDIRSPSSFPATTPHGPEYEMQDVVSDFSTPQDNFFAMSSQGTPESRFTDSDFNPASPKSNGDVSEANYAHHSLPRVKEEPNAPSPATAPPSVGSPGAYRCDECGKTFEQIHRLNHHKRYHERKHQCVVDGCNKKFGTKTHLDRHINDKHKKTRKFYCTEPSCPYSIQGGKSFPRKDNWVRHIRKKHRNLTISQSDSQGFVIDEETGTAQSVAAPPSSSSPPTVEMSMGMNMGMGMGMGYPSNHHHSMSNGMTNGMPMNNGMGMGMSMGMGMQQPPMQHAPLPPGGGFNSAWNIPPPYHPTHPNHHHHQPPPGPPQ